MVNVFITYSSMIKVGRYFNKSYKELVNDVVDEVISNVKSIDYVVVSSVLSAKALNQLDISTIINQNLGLTNVKSTRVETGESSGLAAIEYAYYLIKSGLASNVLVVGIEKLTEYPTQVTNEQYSLILDYELETLRNISPPNYAALAMKEYMKRYNVSREDLTSWPIKMHENAVDNPYAQLRFKVSKDKVLNSMLISEPIRLLDTFPIGDGAAALILSNKCSTSGCVELVGIESSVGQQFYLRRDILQLPASKAALGHLINKHSLSIDAIKKALIELHDSYSIYGILLLEELGICDRGRGWREIDELDNINLSGGLKARGHPLGATGVYQLSEIHKLMSDGLGSKRYDGEYALVHSMSGPDYNARVCFIRRGD